jgi:AraC-like DNA-binding protein
LKLFISQKVRAHTIDHKEYPVHPPVIFFVRKEQVHHWNLHTVPDGFVMILKKPFIDESLDDELKTLLTKIGSLSSVRIKDKKTIDELFRLLILEYNTASEYHFALTEGLLKALLAKVMEVAVPVLHTSKNGNNLFQSYRELLRNNKDICNNVSYYAKKLNTTPQNLNAICRKAVNQSAADVLGESLIGEAKRLLFYTDNTISEISFLLNFNDPSHFVKYFRRFTGSTPKVFRNS